MTTFKYGILLICIVLLSACVQVTEPNKKRETQLAVSSVWDINNHFVSGATFKLEPKYLEKSSIPEDKMKEAYQTYHNAIVQQAQSAGFRQVNKIEDADFIIGYGVALSEDLDDKTISKKFGITPGLQGAKNLEKGSFLIYAENSATKQRIWRGAVQGFVQHDFDHKARVERAEHVVTLVFSQFLNAM